MVKMGRLFLYVEQFSCEEIMLSIVQLDGCSRATSRRVPGAGDRKMRSREPHLPCESARSADKRFALVPREHQHQRFETLVHHEWVHWRGKPESDWSELSLLMYIWMEMSATVTEDLLNAVSNNQDFHMCLLYFCDTFSCLTRTGGSSASGKSFSLQKNSR